MNTSTVTITDPITNVATDFVIIDLGNGNFQSMPKADYDKLPSNSSTPQAGA
jgi:hypothetical protein